MDEKTNDVTTTASARRAPFPAAIPRAAKRTGTRDSPPPVTAHVRVIAAALEEDQRSYIGRKLGMKLGKFAASIERVSVRVADVNGPRGGVDQRCRVKVVLSGLPSVVVERRHSNVDAAIDAALRATGESVRRTVGRRRMKLLHGRASSARRHSRQRSRLVDSRNTGSDHPNAIAQPRTPKVTANPTIIAAGRAAPSPISQA